MPQQHFYIKNVKISPLFSQTPSNAYFDCRKSGFLQKYSFLNWNLNNFKNSFKLSRLPLKKLCISHPNFPQAVETFPIRQQKNTPLSSLENSKKFLLINLFRHRDPYLGITLNQTIFYPSDKISDAKIFILHQSSRQLPCFSIYSNLFFRLSVTLCPVSIRRQKFVYIYSQNIHAR